jgi:hypothetical protein
MTLGFGITLIDKLEMCPYMKECSPEDNEIEDYCVINYQNCEKYIQREKIKLKFRGI